MFAADIESEVIFEIAEALRVPVLVLTVLALAVVLVELGGFCVELSRRRRRDLKRLRTVAEATRRMLDEDSEEAARTKVHEVAWSASMARTLSRLLEEWGRADRDSVMAKTLAEHDFGSRCRSARRPPAPWRALDRPWDRPARWLPSALRRAGYEGPASSASRS